MTGVKGIVGWKRDQVRHGVAVLCLGAGIVAAQASSVTLRISAVNPLDTPQTKEVRAHLPPHAGPDDVLDADGLEVRYDVGQDGYYVARSVELAPKSRQDFRVVIRDVWVVSAAELAALRERAGALAELLSDTAHAATGATLRDGMEKALAEIEADQSKHALAAGARPVDHIRAFQMNTTRLRDVRTRLARLENLVLASGVDPGRLLGEDPRVPISESGAPDDAEPTGEALIRVTVRNPSPTAPRRIDVQHVLPAEIRAGDILDADGLDVAADAASGATRVYKDGLELAPQETVTYNVIIRDRWNVNRPRMARIKAEASELRERVVGMGRFDSVVTLLDEAIEALAALEEATAPETLDDRYVAFFRRQRDALDALERRIRRIEVALRPAPVGSRLGFEARPPDEKTTWRIIWGILGFLGVLSLLFFLRWYGRSKAERMDEQGEH